MLFGCRPSGVSSDSPASSSRRRIGGIRRTKTARPARGGSTAGAARARWVSLGAATAVAIGLGLGKVFSKLLRCRGGPDDADESRAPEDERGTAEVVVEVVGTAPVHADAAVEAVRPPSVGVTVAVTSRAGTPRQLEDPTSGQLAVGHPLEPAAGRAAAGVGASRHSYRHRRDMLPDLGGHVPASSVSEPVPERAPSARDHPRAPLSAMGWGRLARQYQVPPFRRSGRYQQEQDELNRLLDLALDSPLQLLVEFQRQSPIVERLMRLQNAEEAHLEHLPWQLIVAHQQLELAIDQMSYEDLWEHFGGAATPTTACRETLEKLPSHIVTEKHACVGVGAGGYHSCPICLQLFSIGEEFRSLECSHSFHKCCVDTWLTQHRGDCPVCRKSVCKA